MSSGIFSGFSNNALMKFIDLPLLSMPGSDSVLDNVLKSTLITG
jgi:hypothetical protein